MPRKNEPGMPGEKGKTSGSGQVSRYIRSKSTGLVSWADVDGGRLVDMLAALQSAGDAAIFGSTRDGGVLVLTVCSGDERAKFYAATAQEMDAHIQDVTSSALSLAGR